MDEQAKRMREFERAERVHNLEQALQVATQALSLETLREGKASVSTAEAARQGLIRAGSACWIAGIVVSIPELDEFRRHLDDIVAAGYTTRPMDPATAAPTLAGVQAQLALRRWIEQQFPSEGEQAKQPTQPAG